MFILGSGNSYVVKYDVQINEANCEDYCHLLNVRELFTLQALNHLGISYLLLFYKGSNQAH